MKICVKCKLKKDYNEFTKRSSSKDGLHNKCKSCTQLWNKEYDSKNKLNKSLYYINNKEYLQKIHKINKRLNKDRNILYQLQYQNNRYHNDPIFKLKFLISNIVRKSFKQINNYKNQNSSIILGCSSEEFKLYIESLWENWMNWENYGLYNGEINYGWDLDHIIPLKTAKTEEDVIKLNHYTNFQPLCSYTNRYIKKDILDF